MKDKTDEIITEALIQVSIPTAVNIANVVIDQCPHQGGRYGAAIETAVRIVAAGPRRLVGSETTWLLSAGTTPPNAFPAGSIPPALPANVLPPLSDFEFRVPDLPLRNLPGPSQQGTSPSSSVPPMFASGPGLGTEIPGTGFDEYSSGKNLGWSLLTASLKILKSKYKLPSTVTHRT